MNAAHPIFHSRLKMSAPKPFVIAGYTSLLVGLYAFGSLFFESTDPTLVWQLLFFGLLASLLGGLFAFTHEGVLIDFGQHRFRQYTSVLGIKFGGWNNLPIVEKVKLAPFTSSYTIQNAISPVFTIFEEDYKVSLFLQGDDFALPVSISGKRKAIQTAYFLSNQFRVELINAIEE